MKQLFLIWWICFFHLNAFTQNDFEPPVLQIQNFPNDFKIIKPTVQSLIHLVHLDLNSWKSIMERYNYKYFTEFTDNNYIAYDNGINGWNNKVNHMYRKSYSDHYVEMVVYMKQQTGINSFFDELRSIKRKYNDINGHEMLVVYNSMLRGNAVYDVTYRGNFYNLYLNRNEQIIKIGLSWDADKIGVAPIAKIDGGAYLKKEPNINSERIGHINNDEVVTILEESLNDFFLVDYKGTKGYISKYSLAPISK